MVVEFKMSHIIVSENEQGCQVSWCLIQNIPVDPRIKMVIRTDKWDAFKRFIKQKFYFNIASGMLTGYVIKLTIPATQLIKTFHESMTTVATQLLTPVVQTPIKSR